MGYYLVVLILVVVDDELVLKVQYTFGTIKTCLNPYCSGRWSSTEANANTPGRWQWVIILIAVDDGLVPNAMAITNLIAA